jgi:hypothetical protein
VRYRTLISTGIAISSLIVGASSQASAKPPQATAPALAAPALSVTAAGTASPTVPLAPPKPVPPMKKLPKGASAKDFQRALDAYAAQTAQTYSVDASDVDPATAGKSKFTAAADPDVPDLFTYLTVDQCRDLGTNSYWDFTTGGVGRIYNHYQWCAWSLLKLQIRETINGREYPTGELTYRQTVIGWGSKSTNEVLVRVYIDQVNADNGGKLTPGNASLTVNTSCEFVYDGTSCSTSPSAGQTATFLDFANGKVLEFRTTVDLPTNTSENPDRKTGLDLNVHFLATNTLQPGKVVDFGTVKPVVRCDGSTRGGFNGPACIFGGVVPIWSLSRNDPEIGQVAQHIYDALNSPNSTMPPDPSGNKFIPYNLTRTVDGNMNNAQRARAVYQCSKWFTKQSDESCDEYPFASTYQGTFNDPETNYSVRYIDATHNSTEGNKRGVWYYYDRILELDGFRVNPY